MGSWALVSLPVFSLLTVLLWNYRLWPCSCSGGSSRPSTAYRCTFCPRPCLVSPSLKQAVRHWPQLLKGQLFASLTWRRLSMSRSFALPVSQLEGLDGDARQRRLGVLLQRNAGAARWLTTIGVHLEIGLWFGAMALFYLFIPQQIELDWDWQRLILASGSDVLWLEHLSNAFYALVLVFWEPIYVACGFSLYLNRRTVLEAWDLELVFRRLRQRLSNVAPLLLLVVGLALLHVSPPAMADETTAHKPLSTQAASQSIQALLEKPPFKNRKPSHAIGLVMKSAG